MSNVVHSLVTEWFERSSAERNVLSVGVFARYYLRSPLNRDHKAEQYDDYDYGVISGKNCLESADPSKWDSTAEGFIS